MSDESTIENAEAAPDYLARFGLRRAPFAAKPDADFFCADSTLTQRLDMLQHLTEFGMLLLLVIGEPGSGKTSVMQQFLRRAGSNWCVCHLEGDALGNAHDLVQDLAAGFGVPGADLTQLRAHLDSLRAPEQLAVLAVDDAERLPEAALRTLLELSGPAGRDQKRLRLVLFGTPELQDLLAALSPEQAENTHTLTIPRLTELQTAAYLHHRLSVAGLDGEQPFTPAQAKTIHKAARGLPALINARAEQMLSDIHDVSGGARVGMRVAAAAVTIRPGRWGIGAAALLVVALLGVLFWPEAEQQTTDAAVEVPQAVTEPAPETTVELALPDQAPKAAPDGKTETPAADIEPALDASLPMPTLGPQRDQPEVMSPQGKIEVSAQPAPEPPPAVTTTPPPVAAAPVATPATPAAAEPTITPDAATPDTASAPAPAALPKDAEKPVESPARPAAVAKEKTAPLGDSDWLAAQRAGDYTLQVLGGTNSAKIRQFVKTQGLKGTAAILHTTRQGQDWYVLVYGVYPTRAAASAALAKLPSAVRASHPWPRTIASLRGGN